VKSAVAVGDAYPMKTNRKRAAVISAPREAGDNIPSIANATTATSGCSTDSQRPHSCYPLANKKGSPHSITEHRVPELIPVLGITNPTVGMSFGLKRAATNFAVW